MLREIQLELRIMKTRQNVFRKSDFLYTLKNDYVENISDIVNIRLHIETQKQYLWLHSIAGNTGYTGCFLLLQDALKLHTKIYWACTK